MAVGVEVDEARCHKTSILYCMRLLLGVDEAGRGPLAGPVAVGIVAVKEGFDVATEFPGVADSKKLSEKKREKFFELLETHAAEGSVRFVVELGSAADIDEQGIAVVIRAAIKRGVDALVKCESLTSKNQTSEMPLKANSDPHILLDGGLRAPAEYSQETIIGGDASVPLISLASIAAKVTRDRLIVALAPDYPAYGFEKHKGYGTKAHYEALAEHGPCALHRRTFLH